MLPIDARSVCWNGQGGNPTEGRDRVTLLWFVIWIISDNIGDHEPLLFDPVNVWVWTLILAVALDLGGQHARSGAHHR